MIFIPLCKSWPGSGKGKGQDRARKAAEPVCKEETGFFLKKSSALRCLAYVFQSFPFALYHYINY